MIDYHTSFFKKKRRSSFTTYTICTISGNATISETIYKKKEEILYIFHFEMCVNKKYNVWGVYPWQRETTNKWAHAKTRSSFVITLTINKYIMIQTTFYNFLWFPHKLEIIVITQLSLFCFCLQHEEKWTLKKSDLNYIGYFSYQDWNFYDGKWSYF